MDIERCMCCMEETQSDICPHCGYVKGTEPKEIYHIVPGTILHNKYIIGKVLGYGGFGITYIGWDNTLGRKVAVKEFLPSEFSTRMPGETMITVYNGEATAQFNAGLERFIEEAQRLAKFNHVGSIVDIYDTFIENNTGYIIMECLEGDTVKDILKKNGVMPYESAKLIILEILKTLSVVHKEGIIHRDISPDNIFITNDNKTKLLDFGAARYASTFHSKSLSVILKPGYAPEEQYRSRGNQGPWSDIYATAATLYKMITGITIEESMERAVKDNVKSPLDLGIKMSEASNNAIMNALNIHAEKRTQSADDFINDLTSEDVVRVIDNPYKSDAGKIPKWLKIATVSIVSIAMIFGVLVISGVINIKGLLTPTVIADETVRVPYIINQLKDKGEETLNEKGFAMQISDQAYDEFAAKDIIKSQTPAGGKIAEECNTRDDNGRPVVYVVVSGGHAPVIVPDIKGYMKEEAETILKNLGFAIQFEEEYSENEPVGKVLLQDISNMEYAYGSTILLTVSKGKMTVDPSKTHKIPSLVGMTYEQASKKLMAIGMYSKRVEKASTLKEGQVLEQSVVADIEMAEGTTVVLSVSTNTIVIPDVRYKDAGTAQNMIISAGAKVTITYEKSKNVKKGNVISQSISGKSTAGTTVTIVVSTGYTDEKPIINTTPQQNYQSGSTSQPTKPSTPVKDKAYIPSVVNKTEATAKNEIHAAGAYVRYTQYEYSDYIPKGNVISQSISGTADVGAQVDIVVSNGSKPVEEVVTVPNIIGKYVGTNYNNAYNTLKSDYPEINKCKNIKFDTISGSAYASGIIVKTEPAPGSVISPGKTLKIYIAK